MALKFKPTPTLPINIGTRLRDGRGDHKVVELTKRCRLVGLLNCWG